MKKLLLFPLAITQLLFLSCSDELFSPLNNLQISRHILSGYFVTKITFDSRGTAWIGTFKQGLIKYNGSITHYDATNSSLPDSIVIRDIAVDKNDNIWIGSGKGLIKYNRKNFFIYDTSNAPLPTNNVSSIAVDANNNIWFTSCVFQEGGLMKYDGNNWNLYSPHNSQLPSSLINDISVDYKNNKWIAVGEGVNNYCLVKMNGDSWTLYGEEEIGFSPYFLWRIASFKNQIHASINYMLSSDFNINRPNIISYNGSQWKVNNPVDKDGNSLGYVGEIAVDLKGNLWAETSENGIAVFDGHKWFYNKSELSIGNGVGVFDIEVENNNSIWVGCGDGIYIIN